jgi:hypothetical protein
MLNDLRNLLGRRVEVPAGLRTAASGEPLARVEVRLKGLGFDEKRDPLEIGRRSWGGEAVKHSSKVGVDTFEEKSPHPNLKVGSGLFSCCLKDTVLVE